MNAGEERRRRFQEMARAVGAAALDTSIVEEGGDLARTGVAAVDGALGGGFRYGSAYEIVEAGEQGGASLLLDLLLGLAARERRLCALVDAADGFSPDCVGHPDWLDTLLWVRCGSLAKALTAAEWLVVEKDIRFVWIDLRSAEGAGREEERALRAEPMARWYRWQRASRRNGQILFVASSFPFFRPARARLRVSAPGGAEAWFVPRGTLYEGCTVDTSGPTALPRHAPIAHHRGIRRLVGEEFV